VTPSHDAADDPATPIDGLSLSEYVDVCRALVRDGGDSARRIEKVLAAFDLTADRWARERAIWTELIRSHPDIRSDFQRLYAGPSSTEAALGNE
jgi:hypothetical protein